jgi:hypothetical protein
VPFAQVRSRIRPLPLVRGGQTRITRQGSSTLPTSTTRAWSPTRPFALPEGRHRSVGTRRSPGSRPHPSLSGVRSPRWRSRRSLWVQAGSGSQRSSTRRRLAMSRASTLRRDQPGRSWRPPRPGEPERSLPGRVAASHVATRTVLSRTPSAARRPAVPNLFGLSRSTYGEGSCPAQMAEVQRRGADGPHHQRGG